MQQMAPAKQAKVIKEFQKQSAQMDMTVKIINSHVYCNTFIFSLRHLVKLSSLLTCVANFLDNKFETIT